MDGWWVLIEGIWWKWTTEYICDLFCLLGETDSPEGQLRWYHRWTQWGKTCMSVCSVTVRNSPPRTPVTPGSWWRPWKSSLPWQTEASCRSRHSRSYLHNILTPTLQHFQHQQHHIPHTQICSCPTPKLTLLRRRWGNTWAPWLLGRSWQNQEVRTSGRSVEASPPCSKTLVGHRRYRGHSGFEGIGHSLGDTSCGR